ncbi:MAG: RHS repeat-associated core domain-containing protein, partial [Lysobacter sp.]|nr:RHS repeat-associated core domain-containing protein [Lysobacter sp.]
IERTNYEPFGKVIGGTPKDGPGYTGHVLDTETGLNYMQQRYYDPIIGRFLSVDPVAVDTKTAANFCRYCYASNNPYRFTDPDGRASVERAIDRDIKDVSAGNISKTEFNDRALARGAGAAVGTLAVAGAVGAVQAGVIPAVAAAAGKFMAVTESASLSVGTAAAAAQNLTLNAATRVGAAIVSAGERIATQATQAIAATNANLVTNPQAIAAAADAVQATLPGPPPMTPVGVATHVVSTIKDEIHK